MLWLAPKSASKQQCLLLQQLALLSLPMLQAVSAQTIPDPFCSAGPSTPALYSTRGMWQSYLTKQSVLLCPAPVQHMSG
jgi:hypothetical protein